MNEEIQEILNKLSNRKQETLLQGIRECQLKNIEHPFITREEYIDKTLNYINNLQQENAELKKQLEYLRSGEYLNQLKFERNLLEDIIQDKELSNEVYSMKEMTKANTKLCEKLELSESVIKEIREYINKNKLYNYKYDEEELFEIITDEVAKKDLLQILNKGEK